MDSKSHSYAFKVGIYAGLTMISRRNELLFPNPPNPHFLSSPLPRRA